MAYRRRALKSLAGRRGATTAFTAASKTGDNNGQRVLGASEEVRRRSATAAHATASISYSFGSRRYLHARANQALGARLPTADEELLAGKIRQRVDWYRTTPEANRDVTPEYIEGLREIAVRALTTPVQRWEFVEQESRFAALYDTPEDTSKDSFTVKIGDDGDIVFHREGAAEPKPEVLKGVRDVLKLERLITELYNRIPDPAERQEKLYRMRKHLQSAGKFVVKGDTKLAEAALEDIEADALQECGAPVRSHYLSGLAKAYLKAGFGSCVLILLYGKLVLLYGKGIGWLNGSPPQLAGLKITDERLAFIAVATISLLFGAWLSAANRIQSNEKAVLEALISETLRYWVRAVFVLGIGWLTLLLLHKQVVIVSLGLGGDPNSSIDTKYVLRQLPAAVLIGTLLGLAERALPTAVVKRAESLASKLEPKTT